MTVEDEAVLCSFQYELEQGLQRYEDAKAAGELGTWPPRTLHPTQGLPAIGAALKAGGGRARVRLRTRVTPFPILVPPLAACPKTGTNYKVGCCSISLSAMTC